MKFSFRQWLRSFGIRSQKAKQSTRTQDGDAPVDPAEQAVWNLRKLDDLKLDRNWPEFWRTYLTIPEKFVPGISKIALPIKDCMADKDWMTASLMSHHAVKHSPEDPENWFNAAIVQVHCDNILGANQYVNGCLIIDPSWKARVRNEPALIPVNFQQHLQQISLLPHTEHAQVISKQFIDGVHSATLLENPEGAQFTMKGHTRPVHRFILLAIGNMLAPLGYAVASEHNLLAELGGGSHCLCEWDADNHINHGFSDDWGVREKFLEAALELARKRFPSTDP